MSTPADITVEATGVEHTNGKLSHIVVRFQNFDLIDLMDLIEGMEEYGLKLRNYLGEARGAQQHSLWRFPLKDNDIVANMESQARSLAVLRIKRLMRAVRTNKKWRVM